MAHAGDDTGGHEARIETARETAERELLTFCSTVASHLQTWLPAKVTEYVKLHHAVTFALGERLSELKRELTDFYATLPGKAREWLDRPNFWMHRTDFDLNAEGAHNTLYRFSPRSDREQPGRIGASLQGGVSSSLQQILTRYGYGYARHSGDDYFRIPWLGQLAAGFAKYDSALQALHQAKKEYGDHVEARAREGARALWETA